MFKKLFLKIKRYFENTQNYSAIRFIIELTLLSYIIRLFLILPFLIIMISVLLSAGIHQSTLDSTVLKDYQDSDQLYAILIAPIIETAIGQWLPIWIASFFTTRTSILLFVSTIVFVGFHVYPLRILTVLPIGIILAWSFVVNRRKSTRRAFGVTIAIHALHNSIAILLQSF